MILHGVCRDTTEFPRMHIYCQLWDMNSKEDSSENEELSNGDSSINTNEIRIAPRDCKDRKNSHD
jgi:hypothetical protein